MKLEGREQVEGTEVTIGRRVRYGKTGKVLVKTYSAEYRDESGKQVLESLDTTNLSRARRKALEIAQRLEQGLSRPVKETVTVEQLVDEYFAATKAKGLAPKSESKYKADLDKLKDFCREQKIILAHTFGKQQLFAYRDWLIHEEYADKTIYGALILAKQVFKWGHAEGRLRDYRLAGAKVAKAKAKPQPCFTKEEVELIVAMARRKKTAT